MGKLVVSGIFQQQLLVHLLYEKVFLIVWQEELVTVRGVAHERVTNDHQAGVSHSSIPDRHSSAISPIPRSLMTFLFLPDFSLRTPVVDGDGHWSAI
jgi:hypothetical protein